MKKRLAVRASFYTGMVRFDSYKSKEGAIQSVAMLHRCPGLQFRDKQSNLLSEISNTQTAKELQGSFVNHKTESIHYLSF